MGQIVIRTIVPGHTGSLGALNFVDGQVVADEATHAAEIAYCRTRGYIFPDADEAAADVVAEPEETGAVMPKKSASADAWRTYAVENGMPAEEAASLSRDQLVERFTSSKEDEL